ncbi:MAG: hypothetical protein JWN27_3919 [Candidatus Eremiobacteraeota bacterium]|nr:hypothetical protein [Candidatus Eremiobacteraeota bacterium]
MSTCWSVPLGWRPAEMRTSHTPLARSAETLVVVMTATRTDAPPVTTVGILALPSPPGTLRRRPVSIRQWLRIEERAEQRGPLIFELTFTM